MKKSLILSLCVSAHPEGAGYNYYKGKYIDPELCIKNDSSVKDICPIHQNVYSRDTE